MGKPRKDTPEFLEAFVQQYEVNLAQLTKTCEDLGVHHQAVEEWRRQYPDFNEKLNKVQSLLNEKVERSLVELALNEEKPNIVAKIFYLKNNWNQKYGERPMERAGEAVLWFEKKEDKHVLVADTQRDTLPVGSAPDSEAAGQ